MHVSGRMNNKDDVIDVIDLAWQSEISLLILFTPSKKVKKKWCSYNSCIEVHCISHKKKLQLIHNPNRVILDEIGVCIPNIEIYNENIRLPKGAWIVKLLEIELMPFIHNEHM